MHPSLRLFLTRYPWLYEGLWQLMGHRDLEKRVFLRCVRAGDTVLDVGANRGYFTLLFSNRVGPKGQVYAFEPVAPTHDRLLQYLTTHQQLHNIQVINSALGNTTGQITVYLPDADDGQASMAKQGEVGTWATVKEVTAYECAMMRLDDYATTHPLQRIDFIKIDVEGAELLVLQGAEAYLKKYQPILHLEVCPVWMKQFNYQAVDLVSFLQPFGYTHYYWYGDSLKALQNPVLELQPERLPVSANLICMVPERHTSQLKSLHSLMHH